MSDEQLQKEATEESELDYLLGSAFEHVNSLTSLIGAANEVSTSGMLKNLSKHYRSGMFDDLVKSSSELCDLLKLINKKSKKIKRVKLTDQEIDQLVMKKVYY